MSVVWTGNTCPHYKTKEMSLLWRFIVVQCRIRIFLKLNNDRYYISMINAKRLKRICALSGIHLFSEAGTNKTEYYIKLGELNNFIRVMRQHKIEVLFC